MTASTKQRPAYGPLRAAWRSMPRWRWPWLVLIVLCLLITPVVIYNPVGWQSQQEYQLSGRSLQLFTRGHFSPGKSLKIRIQADKPLTEPLSLLINDQRALPLNLKQTGNNWQAQGSIKLPDAFDSVLLFSIVSAEKTPPALLAQWDFKQPLPPSP